MKLCSSVKFRDERTRAHRGHMLLLNFWNLHNYASRKNCPFSLKKNTLRVSCSDSKGTSCSPETAYLQLLHLLYISMLSLFFHCIYVYGIKNQIKLDGPWIFWTSASEISCEDVVCIEDVQIYEMEQFTSSQIIAAHVRLICQKLDKAKQDSADAT